MDCLWVYQYAKPNCKVAVNLTVACDHLTGGQCQIKKSSTITMRSFEQKRDLLVGLARGRGKYVHGIFKLYEQFSVLPWHGFSNVIKL